MDIKSAPEKTKRRVDQLHEYMSENLLADGKFVCKYRDKCRASCPNQNGFYEGQMSHVGKYYDLTVGGKELRIVVVGQEYGSWHTCVTLKERTAMIDCSAKAGFQGRNRHIRGTTFLLRLMLGQHSGKNREGDLLCFPHPQPVGHIFDGFALVNFLLCSALKTPRTSSRAGSGCSSRTMQKNCVKHFEKTLEILEPTVIVAQGKGVRSWIRVQLGLWIGDQPTLEKKALAKPDGQVETTRIDGKSVEVLTFNHPSAWGEYGWSSPKSKYLKETVEPTIKKWRDRWRICSTP